MTEATPIREWPTISAAAVEAGVGTSTMRVWARRYGLGQRVGGRWRINPSRLAAMLTPTPARVEVEQRTAA